MNNEIYEEIFDHGYVLLDKVDYSIEQVKEQYPSDRGWNVEVVNIVNNPDGKTCTITYRVTKSLNNGKGILR